MLQYLFFLSFDVESYWWWIDRLLEFLCVCFIIIKVRIKVFTDNKIIRPVEYFKLLLLVIKTSTGEIHNLK